jgi:hypothetical protein
MGLGTGAMIDSGKPDYKIVEKDQVTSIEPGTKTILYVGGGYTKAGKFAGFAIKPNELKNGEERGLKSASPDSLLILQSPESIKTEYIPLQDLYFAEVKTRKNAKYIGLGIGLLIDIAMVATSGGSR